MVAENELALGKSLGVRRLTHLKANSFGWWQVAGELPASAMSRGSLSPLG